MTGHFWAKNFNTKYSLTFLLPKINNLEIIFLDQEFD